MIKKTAFIQFKTSLIQLLFTSVILLLPLLSTGQDNMRYAEDVIADKICVTGDMDNLGFGWPAGFDVFSGKSTPRHGYPWNIDPTDASGMDRIIVGSSATNKRDGYAARTKRPENSPQPIYVNCNFSDVTIRTAVIQLFVDDFQAPVWKSKFQVTLNGKRAVFIEDAINSLNQTGPIGKLLTLQVPADFIPDIASEDFEIFIDDPTTGQGDGFAIDFIRILINPRNFTHVGIVQGQVIDAVTKQPISNALVSAGGIVSVETDYAGNFTLNGVPAGMASLTVSSYAHEDQTKTVDLPANSTKTLNFELNPAKVTPPPPPSTSDYPTSWEVNCNGYVGLLDYTVDPVTFKVNGTLLGTPIEGFLVDRHLVIHRYPQGKTQIWDGWIMDQSLGAHGKSYYDDQWIIAGTGSQSLGPVDGVYPWYGTATGGGSQKKDPVAGVLDGLRWEMPCVPGGGGTCRAAVPKPMETATLGGDPNTTYEVTLRFRGVVEYHSYAGGQQDGLWYVGGRSNQGSYNIYKLETTNPPQTFFLNADRASIGRFFQIDYTRTIRVKGGSKVILSADAQDGTLISNHDGSGNPIIIPGIAPAPAKYDGQFIQMDVLEVKATTYQ